MQIILIEKVANLGQLGDIIKVKDGYARNFLIPQGKARRATKVNIDAFEIKRAEYEKTQAETLRVAHDQASKINGLMLQITQKAGVDGKLFGSVTNQDILEALKVNGFDVPRVAIRLPHGPLKKVGDYQLSLALHTDVAANITISVLGES